MATGTPALVIALAGGALAVVEPGGGRGVSIDRTIDSGVEPLSLASGDVDADAIAAIVDAVAHIEELTNVELRRLIASTAPTNPHG